MIPFFSFLKLAGEWGSGSGNSLNKFPCPCDGEGRSDGLGLSLLSPPSVLVRDDMKNELEGGKS